MRGKDFSFSLVRKHASLKRTTWDRIAVISDPTCRMRPSKKKFKKSNNEENKNQENDDNNEEDDEEDTEIEQGLNDIVDNCLESMEEQEIENDE